MAPLSCCLSLFSLACIHSNLAGSVSHVSSSLHKLLCGASGNADDIPVKIKIQFNKPRLVTLLTPDMFEVLMGLVSTGLIDESGLRDILGIEELEKETVSKGAQGGARPGASRWTPGGRRPIQTSIKPRRSMWRMEDLWNKITQKQLPEAPQRSLWRDEDTWETDPAKLEWMHAREKRLKQQ